MDFKKKYGWQWVVDVLNLLGELEDRGIDLVKVISEKINE